MAARAAKKTASPAAQRAGLFALAERQVLGLYDAGVLSPAVLHHVIAAYAERDIDWHEEPHARSVDDHSLHEVVVLTMMPGRALRNARKDFLTVIAHLADAGATAVRKSKSDSHSEPEQEDDDELLNQLSGAAPKRGKPRAEEPEPAPRKSAGFNPLVKARAVRQDSKD
ncbi:MULTISPECIES: hypothetical protein [unclassified Caballeronia]|uniref:hypothetical protein n=1 Tax=unclassified Caballeronia TaxID=2646786 RepID=UPI00285D2404|nr:MULTISPECIES: hypothetical protein [unclassified Caballeronia]MDR5754148.1 hypothetical protein [Caballeronia sp. LZ024]MDR5840526.1 hypothetical protein [Caballeronia sp. LZ031]